MKKIKFCIIVFLMGILFLSGIIYITEQYRDFQPFLIVGSILCILTLFFITSRRFKVNLLLLSMSAMFFIVCLISALLNQDIELLKGSVLMQFLYVVLGIALPAILPHNACNKAIACSLLIIHLPVVFIPVFIQGISSIPYQGVFYNSNDLGTVAATVYALLFARMCSFAEDFLVYGKNQILKVQSVFVILSGVFVLILYSNSRTSFAAILIITLCCSFIIIKKCVRNGMINRMRFIRTIMFFSIVNVLICALILGTGVNKLIIDTVVEKSVEKSDNVLSGRVDIWKNAVKDMRPFGYGRDYFKIPQIGAHSTYISLLGQYGLIPMVSYCIFLISVGFYSFIYAKNNTVDAYRYFPLCTYLAFIVLSTGEGMLLKSSMLCVYGTLGIVSTKSME